jgi:hypothetical protein
MFCSFIQIDGGIYRCSLCGTKIESSDYNKPIWPCSGLKTSQSEPNLIDKIKNFASSLSTHVKNNFVLASDEKIQNRFNICSQCEFFKNNSCTQCGCPINRHKNYISKLSWDREKCPIDKW